MTLNTANRVPYNTRIPNTKKKVILILNKRTHTMRQSRGRNKLTVNNSTTMIATNCYSFKYPKFSMIILACQIYIVTFTLQHLTVSNLIFPHHFHMLQVINIVYVEKVYCNKNILLVHENHFDITTINMTKCDIRIVQNYKILQL